VADALWVMEDGLRCPALAAVAGDVGDLDFAVSRRLQLAAAGHGVPLLLHRPWRRVLVPSAATTRWRVAARPSMPEAGAGGGDPVWRLDLLRCRGGRPGSWTVAFDCARQALYEAREAAPEPETAPELGPAPDHRHVDAA
jgi:protein ImuA